LTDCLRRHGIKVPATGEQWTPPPGYDPAKAQNALKACLQDQRGSDQRALKRDHGGVRPGHVHREIGLFGRDQSVAESLLNFGA
jgi:hypothetical protein